MNKQIHFRAGKSTSATSLSWNSASISGILPQVREPMWYRASVIGGDKVDLLLEYSSDGETWHSGVSFTDHEGTHRSDATQFVWGLGSSVTNFYLDDITFVGKTFDADVDGASSIPLVQRDNTTVVAEEYYNGA